MKILSFECSSPVAGMAMVVDGQAVAEVTWTTGQRRQHRLFDELESLLGESGVALQDVDAFAIGRGPGNFTGMRISQATAQAMALPEKKPCIALSSGTVLAASWLTGHQAPVAVVGDARRSQCWMGVFFESPEPGVSSEWSLCAYEDLAARLPAGCTLISSEIDRVLAAVPGLLQADVQVIPENQMPSAALLGERVAQCLKADHPGEPMEPLYMHPAV